MNNEQEHMEQRKLPTRKSKDEAIKQMEIDTVNKVISAEDLKTQYAAGERILLPILKLFAGNPFPISAKIAKDRGIKMDTDRFKNPFLYETVVEYTRTGKALARKGISEDVDIISAYFQAQIERAKEGTAKSGGANWDK